MNREEFKKLFIEMLSDREVKDVIYHELFKQEEFENILNEYIMKVYGDSITIREYFEENIFNK